ncbi:ileal sodium/bile acid cotransporter [Silurus asotus]|uniref:Ileal sodium/bile acid cotransporter n=1 Tax=Silurus asotus TaxID=30991 RepID=A0AAD5B6R1_SILAS|nr:ileal sodium/bile acid cotransporter [Silurus asotus]
MARFVGQPWHRCRTIALETGFQNSQLCSTIVQLSFAPDELEVMFSFPLIYSIFQLIVAILSIGSYQLYKRYWKGVVSEEDCEEDDGAPDLASCKDKPEYVLENGGFQSDENGNTEAKGAITHL